MIKIQALIDAGMELEFQHGFSIRAQDEGYSIFCGAAFVFHNKQFSKVLQVLAKQLA